MNKLYGRKTASKSIGFISYGYSPEPWDVVDDAPYVSARDRFAGILVLSSLLLSSSEGSEEI